MKRLTRICALLLALLMLVPLAAGCKKETENEKLTVDTTYQIAYVGEDAYASLAATRLCAGLRELLGERLPVVKEKDLDAQVAEGRVIYVGAPAGMTDLPAMQGAFEVLSRKDGIVIRAQSPMLLYMAAVQIAKVWPTAGYGLTEEGTLTVDEAVCKKLNALDIGASRTISVMSQNVRCADDGGKNDIADRKVRLKQLVEDYSPDLLGTQEVTKTWMGIFEDYFGQTYGMVGCSRDGVNATSGEWNTILYKKERFDLVESGTFWLTDTPDTPSMTEDALCRRICTWAILKDKQTDKEILFCNTHLDHSNDTVRGQQAELLMQFIDKYAGEYPIFLTGDFNTAPGKAPYNTVVKTLTDSHKRAEVELSEVKGTFHGYATPKNEIDFCFYDLNHADAVSYRILSDDYDGFVSDHYGVIGNFVLK